MFMGATEVTLTFAKAGRNSFRLIFPNYTLGTTDIFIYNKIKELIRIGKVQRTIET